MTKDEGSWENEERAPDKPIRGLFRKYGGFMFLAVVVATSLSMWVAAFVARPEGRFLLAVAGAFVWTPVVWFGLEPLLQRVRKAIR
jgi:hypothetical protein